MAPTAETVGSAAPSTAAEPDIDHLKDMTESLRASTDTLIVVEGTASPCHQQIMAEHSKVFADMVDMISSHKCGAHIASHAMYCRAATQYVADRSLCC